MSNVKITYREPTDQPMDAIDARDACVKTYSLRVRPSRSGHRITVVPIRELVGKEVDEMLPSARALDIPTFREWAKAALKMCDQIEQEGQG